MFANLNPALQQNPVFEYTGQRIASMSAVDGFAGTSASAATEAAEPQSFSSAHEAVKVVLQAAEQVSSRDQKSVNLQFSVGDADLTVRVERHAGEVRTTFRTDSNELRAALAQEWQAVTGSSNATDRAARMASATFSGSEQPTSNGLNSDASSQQRNPHAEHSGERERSPVGVSRSRNRSFGASPGAAAPISAGHSASAPSTSRHLHILA
jgi:hypothetical protein